MAKNANNDTQRMIIEGKFIIIRVNAHSGALWELLIIDQKSGNGLERRFQYSRPLSPAGKGHTEDGREGRFESYSMVFESHYRIYRIPP